MTCEMPTGERLVLLVFSLVVVEAINLTIIWALTKYWDNELMIALAGYFCHFFSFMLVYFAFCGFNLMPLVQAFLLLGGSIVIALFLVVYLSPTYCAPNGNSAGGQLSFFFEIMFLGFFCYTLIFYWHHYVYPFLANIPPINNYKYDLIMFGALLMVRLILLGLNYLSQSTNLSYIENTATVIAGIIFFIKMTVQIRQMINSPQTSQTLQAQQAQQAQMMEGGRWGDEQIPHQRYSGTRRRNHVKSAFYDFY